MPKGNSDAKPKSKPSYKTRNNKKNKLRRSKDDSDSDEDISLGDDYEEDEDDDDDDEDYETCSDTSESEYIPVTKKKNKKIVIGNDDDEDDDDDVDEDVDDEEDGDENDPEYRRKFKKFLYEIFPSKYMKKKIESEEEQEEEEEPKRRKSKSQSKTKSKSKRRVEEEQEEDEGEEDEEEEEDERGKVVDILFYGGQGDYVDPEEYDEEDDKGDCDSDDERAFMKENYETIAMPVKSEEKEKKQKKGKKKAVVSDEESDIADVEDDYLDLIETKKTLTQQLNKRPKSKILIHAIDECNRSIKKLVKKARIRNAKAYHKMIHDDKQNTNEIDFFKKKLSNKEQLKVMKELKEINAHMNIDRPYRLALLESKIPAKFKAIALQKLNTLRHMEPGDNEYYKIKNWVDTFMRVPFYNNQNLSITIDDGIEKCHDFMQNAMTILDSCVYGLNDAKLQILQMVGQWISNPSAMGTAIAIKGPMGTGKTTLVKEGISKILGREFAFIALGGAGDSSFLEGHSYTYEGSSWGKIVQILIDSKCMNPVIYFDELDKISDTPRGEEIVGILTHLTDTSQNSQFHDKYFSDIDFDLSKCLFIFSYNDESKVNSILKDRMYRIQTKGYDAKEKITIARNYILPKIREQVNFNDSDVIIPDDTIQYIVTNEALTHGEDGVRNLKRCLEIIYTKLNLFRLVKPDTENIFAKEINIKVSFPFTVTRKDVDVFIKNEQSHNQSMLAMYC